MCEYWVFFLLYDEDDVIWYGVWCFVSFVLEDYFLVVFYVFFDVYFEYFFFLNNFLSVVFFVFIFFVDCLICVLVIVIDGLYLLYYFWCDLLNDNFDVRVFVFVVRVVRFRFVFFFIVFLVNYIF